MNGLDRVKFAEFITLLETLNLMYADVDLLDILDGQLNNLKTLKYAKRSDNGVLLPPIKLNSLETLLLAFGNTAAYIRTLQSMNSNQIKRLVSWRCFSIEDDDDVDDDLINEICKFKTLESLRLPLYMEKLATHLSHTEFELELEDEETKPVEEILPILSILPKLTKLKIEVTEDDFNRLSDELKHSAHDFHARFSKSNTEIKLTNPRDMMYISITTDHLYTFQEDSEELHWMVYLNEENVRKMLKFRWYTSELKFINNYADRTFDISALASEDTECLDFKSNGPISVKTNVCEIFYCSVEPSLLSLYSLLQVIKLLSSVSHKLHLKLHSNFEVHQNSICLLF